MLLQKRLLFHLHDFVVNNQLQFRVVLHHINEHRSLACLTYTVNFTAHYVVRVCVEVAAVLNCDFAHILLAELRYSDFFYFAIVDVVGQPLHTLSNCWIVLAILLCKFKLLDLALSERKIRIFGDAPIRGVCNISIAF